MDCLRIHEISRSRPLNSYNKWSLWKNMDIDKQHGQLWAVQWVLLVVLWFSQFEVRCRLRRNLKDAYEIVKLMDETSSTQELCDRRSANEGQIGLAVTLEVRMIFMFESPVSFRKSPKTWLRARDSLNLLGTHMRLLESTDVQLEERNKFWRLRINEYSDTNTTGPTGSTVLAHHKSSPVLSRQVSGWMANWPRSCVVFN